MKFAFDLDGVIYKYPWIFGKIIRSLKWSGDEVIILTGHFGLDSLEEDKKHLAQLGIRSYAKIIEKPVPGLSSARFKAQVCRDEGIDVFFEDNPETVKEVNKTKTIVMQVIQKEN